MNSLKDILDLLGVKLYRDTNSEYPNPDTNKDIEISRFTK